MVSSLCNLAVKHGHVDSPKLYQQLCQSYGGRVYQQVPEEFLAVSRKVPHVLEDSQEGRERNNKPRITGRGRSRGKKGISSEETEDPIEERIGKKLSTCGAGASLIAQVGSVRE